jgi:precorrin-3B C17-methyltransferase
MSGVLYIVGLGPGAEDLLTPQASAALAAVSDVFGYQPYVDRVAPRVDLVRHASDNREELMRAREALELAACGRKVAIVSSGDPGVFAMAAAVCEALEEGPAAWEEIDVQVLPGITAMLAASARAGAPLGHDFCAINLSDNLKPWALIEHRLRCAVAADFAIALYNPRSRARPEGFARALEILREAAADNRPVLFARAVSTAAEQLQVVGLQQAQAEMADMRTMVIIGSSQTRLLERSGGNLLYTPRSVGVEPHDSPRSVGVESVPSHCKAAETVCTSGRAGS